MVQADLMSTGKLFQSCGAAALKDQSPFGAWYNYSGGREFD